MIRILPVASLLVATLVAACGETAATSAPGGGASTTSSAGSAATESNPSGDIPDTQQFIDATDVTRHFTVKVPSGWAQQDAHGVRTLTDHYNSIRLETTAAASAPTVDSARSGEAPGIVSAGDKVSALSVTSVHRQAGTVILVTYMADSAPDPVTGKVAREAVERYEYWRAGVEAVVTLAAPVGSDNVDPWLKVTDNFRWL